MVLPSGAGSGVDIAARVYAMYLPKYLPGKPTMIVRNMPGASGTIGSNYVYSSKPDGLTVLASSVGVQLAQLFGMSAVKYDLLRMPLLIGAPSGAFYFMKPGIIAKVEDLLTAKGLVYAGGSGTSSSVVLFIVAKELLGIPTDKLIFGYAGAAESLRAFLSGETNVSGTTTAGYEETMAPHVERGEAMLLFQTGLLDEKGDVVKDPNFQPRIPTSKELYEKLYGKQPSGMAWDAYKAVVAGGSNYGRTLFLPPGTPERIVQAYWDACKGMLKDPEFSTRMDRLLGKANWGVGEAYDKRFKADFAIKLELRKLLVDILGKYGVVF